MESQQQRGMGWNLVLAIVIAFTIRGTCSYFTEAIGESARIELIEKDTGCNVTRWTPGHRRNCVPFNISNNEENTTAWLCCAGGAP